MLSSTGKFLALAMVLMLALTPVMADEHLNETEDDSDEEEIEDEENETEEEAEQEEDETDDDSEMDGTDNSTELTITKSEAEETARNALSDNIWELESSSTHEEDGYYRFRFIVSGEDAEAEVRVDGSSGEIFRYEEELEKETEEDENESESEVEEIERVEVQNLEQAKQRIEELRGMVMDLRREAAETEDSESERELDVERRNGETEIEVEQESGEQETEAEIERRGPPENRGPSQNARDAVNGTPGNEQAQQRRPGFVSNFLSGFFS